jgi:hypothetical protein
MPELRDLRVMAEPDATLLALEAAPGSALDPWALAEELWRRGWWVDRQGPPPSIHLTVNAIHGRVLEEFLGDLCAAVGAVSGVGAVRGVGRTGAAGAYETVD